MNRIAAIMLWLALALTPTSGRAQGTGVSCGRMLALRDGRVATRAPTVEPPRPWITEYPERDGWQRVRRRGPVTQPSPLELDLLRTQIGRLGSHDPARPILLLRSAELALQLAAARAQDPEDGVAPLREFESACERDWWQSVGWLRPAAPPSTVRTEVMGYCAFARAAFETVICEHPDSGVYRHAAESLVVAWLRAGEVAAAEAVAASLATRAPDAEELRWAWFDLADHEDRHGRRVEAARWFERYLAACVDPQDRAPAYYRLGLMRLEAADPEGALGFFARVSSPGPYRWFDQEAKRGSAVAYVLSRDASGSWSIPEAIVWIARLGLWEPATDTFERLLRVFAARGRFEWALEGYLHLLTTFPRTRGARWVIAYEELFARARPRVAVLAETARLLDDPRLERAIEPALWQRLYAVAARWHRAALDASTPDRQGLRDAASLYALLGSVRPEIARAIREEQPRPALRAFYRAEALFEAGDDRETAYLDALVESADVSLAAEIRCRATLCRARAIAATAAATPAAAALAR